MITSPIKIASGREESFNEELKDEELLEGGGPSKPLIGVLS